MRILFISSYSLLYGANRSLLTLMCYLKDHGFQVKVIIPMHGEYEKALQQQGIEYEVIRMFNQFLYYKPIRKYLILPFLILWDIFCFPYFLYKIKKFSPTLIYSNAASECLGGLIAKCLHVKHIWHIREFMDRDYNARFYLGNSVRKCYINMSDGALFVSKTVGDAMLLGDELKPHQRVIYNGIDLPVPPMTDKDINKMNPNFGIVGVLCDGKGQKKGVMLMSKILAHYPNAQLHVFGDRDGSYKRSLVALAEQSGVLDHIVFHGFQKELDNIYPTIDILLMFSRSEGFGRVTVEAMNYGVPVIGYDNAGTSEIIESGKDGFLFKSDEDFLKSLDSLMADSSTFNKIRQAAYDKVRKDFNVEKYCSNVMKFIKEIV